jgi:hypothetical protein
MLFLNLDFFVYLMQVAGHRDAIEEPVIRWLCIVDCSGALSLSLSLSPPLPLCLSLPLLLFSLSLSLYIFYSLSLTLSLTLTALLCVVQVVGHRDPLRD